MTSKHYSHTQLMMFTRCPAQYRYRYMEGLKVPPGSALVQGISYHKALEHNHTQKIDSHEDLPTQEVKDAYATAFDTALSQGVEWNDEERSHGIDRTAGELKDEGIGLVGEYQKVLAPGIQPVAVEKPFSVAFEGVDYTLEGRIDLIDDKEIIHDNKTAAKSPSKDLVGRYIPGPNEFIQGSIYSLAHGRNVGENNIVFDYAIKTKVPKVLQVEAAITQEDQRFALTLIKQVDSAIQAQAFWPARTSVMCSRKSCGYWSLCEKEFGGRVKE